MSKLLSVILWKLSGYSLTISLLFKIKADRFLRNMVRAVVGTMIDVGGKENNFGRV